MIKFNVTISEAGKKGSFTYTGNMMKEGETKADMMARVIDDHRFIWSIEDDVELTATAKIERD